MAIRSATTADALSIAQVHVASPKVAYRGQLPAAALEMLDLQDRTFRWQQVLADGSSSTLVFEAHGQIIGFLNYGPSRDRDADPQRVGEIVSLYVDPASWRTGVGRALCQEALQRQVALGFKETFLWVLATNDQARGFYSKAGFTPDGTVKEQTMSDTPVTIVRYWKRMSDPRP